MDSRNAYRDVLAPSLQLVFLEVEERIGVVRVLSIGLVLVMKVFGRSSG